MKLLGHIKRIAMYSGKLIHSFFRKITKGTSSAFKTAGIVVSGILTAILVTSILGMLALVSVPVAAFTTPSEVREAIKVSIEEKVEATKAKSDKPQDPEGTDKKQKPSEDQNEVGTKAN